MTTHSTKKERTLAERIGAVQAALGPEVKTDSVGGRGNTYPSLRQALDTVIATCVAEGITITQPIRTNDGGVVTVSTVVTDAASGEQEISEIPLPVDGRPQEIGSAITYYRRFTLLAALALAPGGSVEDDAEAAELAAAELQRLRAKLKVLVTKGTPGLTWSAATRAAGIKAEDIPNLSETQAMLAWAEKKGGAV
jgi:hypothetical protein